MRTLDTPARRVPSRTIRGALVGLAAGLVLAGCGGGSIATDELEKQISAQLGQQIGREPESVDCAEPLEAEVGATGRCELTDSGSTYGVGVEVTKVEGDTASFDIQVDSAPTE